MEEEIAPDAFQRIGPRVATHLMIMTGTQVDHPKQPAAFGPTHCFGIENIL